MPIALVASGRHAGPHTAHAGVAGDVIGARIANARGVPGTLGAIALRRDGGEPVLLTNHHVLFGAGAVAGDPVWLVDGASARTSRGIGRALYGRLGTVTFEGAQYHVDCAAASLDDGRAIAPSLTAIDDFELTIAWAETGERVTKMGGATGTTEGTVVDVAFTDRVVVDRRRVAAQRQILVRSLARGRAFSSAGDSGAVVCNARGAIVGLLWGVDDSGDSVACHIAPVLYAMHARLVPARSGRAP